MNATFLQTRKAFAPKGLAITECWEIKTQLVDQVWDVKCWRNKASEHGAIRPADQAQPVRKAVRIARRSEITKIGVHFSLERNSLSHKAARPGSWEISKPFFANLIIWSPTAGKCKLLLPEYEILDFDHWELRQCWENSATWSSLCKIVLYIPDKQ